jgi:hypothetical protein
MLAVVRRFRTTDLTADGGGSVLARAVPDYRVDVGGVAVAAPGEDHHLVSSAERPLVTVWLHLAPAA